MAKDKTELSPEVREYFRRIGKMNGDRLKEKSQEKYGDSSEYFRRMAAKRKRFGPLPKDKKLESSE